MRLSVRLVGGIVLSAMLVMAGFTLLQIRDERQRLVDDLGRRAALLAEGLRESVEPAVRRGSPARVARLLKKFARADRRIAVYDRFGSATGSAPTAAPALPSAVPEVTDAVTTGEVAHGLRTMGGRAVFVYATPLPAAGGALAVFLDAANLDAAEAGLWRDNAVRFLVVALVVSAITLLIVRLGVTRPIAEVAEWARSLKTGQPIPPPGLPDARLFAPLAVEVTGLARSLYRAQAAAEREAALRLSGEAVWTEERLKQFVRLRFGDDRLFVVSNREPLSHVWRNGKIVAQTPASGVVTALEPVMRACGGVWVAHGSGSADDQTADARGRLGVPPEDPRYTLRRVPLSEAEEAGYYYGFSNEGLWPLCHVVHARPLFRAEDWAEYRAVNEKFAAALLEEMRDAPAPMVLVQDYHFALLPALVKAARPEARVALFWHIPWPNAEAFAICPWQKDILQGMLGADLVGFHTQYHCNNFLDSVDRMLEARIDAEHFAVVRGEHTTSVKPFPISVASEPDDDAVLTSRKELLDTLGIASEVLGVGVDRIDYTKGLPERFLAVRRFFERYPEHRERVTFVQIAAPSRSRIGRYQELQAEVRRTVEEVNRAVGTRGWQPIVYLEQHHDHRDLWPLYRHADFCLVTSLHDGMNLVAKEYVAAQDNGTGVLVLSRFTGAARELPDALLVNPYDIDESADAIRAAVEMPADERAQRMKRMHASVREYNIYRWAGSLLGALASIPAGAPAARA